MFVEPGKEPPSLLSVLEQLKKPAELTYDGAWDLADILEIELVRNGDDAYLATLLQAQVSPSNDEKSLWDQHFLPNDRAELLNHYQPCSFTGEPYRTEARRRLEYIFQERTKGWRLDRARARLRGNYLLIMALLLLGLLSALCCFYVESEQQLPNVKLQNLLWLVFLSGAVGSVLSRAYKLGQQTMRANPAEKTPEPPLGIRALMSSWRVFLAQPAIGGTIAVILFMVFRSGLVQLAGLSQLSHSAYSVIGFLAGFSEPFAIDILNKVAGHAGSTVRS